MTAGIKFVRFDRGVESHPAGEPMLEGRQGERTQALFMNGPVLGAPGPEEFAAQRMLEQHLGDPEEFKEAISGVARTVEKSTSLRGNTDLANPDGSRDAIVEFFASENGVWDFRAQSRTNLETMPVENGAKEWSQDEIPFVNVARLTIPSQPAYTPVRRAAYATSAHRRHEQSVRPQREPLDASELFVAEAKTAGGVSV